MLRTNIDKDLDLYFDFKIIFLALLSIMYFFFSSGMNTLLYIEDCSPLLVSSTDSVSMSLVGDVMIYKTNLISRYYKLPEYMLFIYWIVLPLIDLFFIVYWFYRGDIKSPKSLYTSLFYNKSGDFQNG